MNIFHININNIEFDLTEIKDNIANNINNFVFIKDKKRALGSYLIKLELLKFLKINKVNVQLKKRKYGKPYFLLDNGEIINFNISHDNNYVILFYNNNRNVGVDILYYKKKKSNNFINNLRKNLSKKDFYFLNNN